MAQLIPNINTCLSRMTSGEKRLARRLEAYLEDDYLIWYDIPVGRKHRYPDFIVLHPARGILFLEVKDWRLETIKKITKSRVELLTNNGRVTVANPIEQARQGAYQVINMLSQDSELVAQSGDHKGKLKFPYGYGAVFPNITQIQLNKALTTEGMHVLPDHLVLCKDEMTETADAEEFQENLWAMFNYTFSQKLSLPEIERIRWHLFPELRIEESQGDLFIEVGDDDPEVPPTIPEMIKVMDLQQEQTARNLGEGHRVIHGVAGSGKTMILGFRAMQLAEALNKPILILCFNVSLAARLRHYVLEKEIENKVQVYHFHDWCGQQIKMYHCDVPNSEAPYWERQVAAVINGVEKAQIPRAQYGAVLIDEGHDFESEWLQLITQMVDPATDSILLLYDDAQSIYKKHAGLDFSLSSVGIKARGRTTILKLNYRNTREILDFAYQFAKEFISEEASDDDHIPVISPESAGASGPTPVFRQFDEQNEELDYITRCINKWLADGQAAGEIAVLVPTNKIAQTISQRLQQVGIPNLCMDSKENKMAYSPTQELVSVLSLHSSKGLEFETVILAGIDRIHYVAKDLADQVRLMYVGMTRAKSQLLITSSESTLFTDRFVQLVAP
jgi:UvrD-like helicase C-terminal domain/Nuclease-related domain/AAA domain